MSVGLRRRLALLVCRVLQAMLPPALRSWGWAIRLEADAIPDDSRALLFALDSLSGLLPRAIAAHLLHPFAALLGEDAAVARGANLMNLRDAVTGRPRLLGVLCAVGATGLGLAYLAVAGAPARYLAINIGALAIGLAMLALLGRPAVAGRRRSDAAMVAMAGALLATASLGAEVGGAARWVALAGLAIQPSLILLPVMLVGFARARSGTATTGIVIAALALALQPDRTMAGTLALCVTVLAVMRPDRHTVMALAAGLTAFASTLARADTLPAAPFVDRILHTAFDVHFGAGLAVWSGAALLLVPAIAGRSRDPDDRAAHAAFGAVWLAAIAAAALGNSPTPVVGHGGSAIIGYVLSLLALPKRAGVYAGNAAQRGTRAEGSPSGHHLLAALA